MTDVRRFNFIAETGEAGGGVNFVFEECGHSVLAIGHKVVRMTETRPHLCPICDPGVEMPDCCDDVEMIWDVEEEQ